MIFFLKGAGELVVEREECEREFECLCSCVHKRVKVQLFVHIH